MSSSHHPSEPSSAASTPRSEYHQPRPPHRWHHLLHDGSAAAAAAAEDEPPAAGPHVRLMCSFGGRILPRPHDHQLRYAGGETRIVALPRSASFATLLAKLAKLCGATDGDAMQVKYQLPHEDLDALISVISDEDVEIMMEEHDRLAALGGGAAAARTPRLRLFLFSSDGDLGSLHGGGDDHRSRRDRWFLDALNGGAVAALEREQSEASSLVSELPDYLFGLDGNLDARGPKLSNLIRSAYDFPESPVHPTPTDRFEPPKSVDPPTPPPPEINPTSEPVQHGATAGNSSNQTWHYTSEPGPVYFIPTSVPPQQAGPVPVPLHMSFGLPNQRPVPVVYQQLSHEFNANPVRPPIYVGCLPTVQSGPASSYGFPTSIPQGYGLPAGVDGGAHYGVTTSQGGVVSVNSMTGIPPGDSYQRQ